MEVRETEVVSSIACAGCCKVVMTLFEPREDRPDVEARYQVQQEGAEQGQDANSQSSVAQTETGGYSASQAGTDTAQDANVNEAETPRRPSRLNVHAIPFGITPESCDIVDRLSPVDPVEVAAIQAAIAENLERERGPYSAGSSQFDGLREIQSPSPDLYPNHCRSVIHNLPSRENGSGSAAGNEHDSGASAADVEADSAEAAVN